MTAALIAIALFFTGCGSNKSDPGYTGTKNTLCFGLEGVYRNGLINVTFGRDGMYQYCGFWSRCGEGHIRAYDPRIAMGEVFLFPGLTNDPAFPECPVRGQWTTLGIELSGNTLTIDSGIATFSYVRDL